MSHIVDAHVAYCTAISELSRDKTELLERIKRMEEAGDKMFPWSERVGQEFWTAAKEAKL